MEQRKVKIMMLGESGVGKSCLLARFVDNKFDSQVQTTLGVEFRKKKFIINNVSVDVQVWDTAGQERFRTITPSYYRNVQGVILVYDITCQQSFDSISYWLDNLKEHGNEKIVTSLIGSKLDLMDKREVQRETGFNFSQKYNMQFWETSAKTNIHVEDVFKKLTEAIIENADIPDINSNTIPIQQDQSNDKCC